MMLSFVLVVVVCLVATVAMPYEAPLQGVQGGFRTLVIVEDMVNILHFAASYSCNPVISAMQSMFKN